MRYSTRILRRPRRAWLRPARTAAAVIAAAVLALLAACGGGPSSAGAGGSQGSGGSASSPSAVAYSACMRSHGVPNYPDPSSNGSLPKGNPQAFGVSSSQFQAARTACQHLLPNSETFIASLTQCLETGDCPQAVVQQALTEGRKFAQCMRNHGVPNWPDPTIDSMGRPSFNVTGAGIPIASTRSSQMLSTIGHCQNQPGAVLLRQE